MSASGAASGRRAQPQSQSQSQSQRSAAAVAPLDLPVTTLQLPAAHSVGSQSARAAVAAAAVVSAVSVPPPNSSRRKRRPVRAADASGSSGGSGSGGGGSASARSVAPSRPTYRQHHVDSGVRREATSVWAQAPAAFLLPAAPPAATAAAAAVEEKQSERVLLPRSAAVKLEMAKLGMAQLPRHTPIVRPPPPPSETELAATIAAEPAHQRAVSLTAAGHSTLAASLAPSASASSLSLVSPRRTRGLLLSHPHADTSNSNLAEHKQQPGTAASVATYTHSHHFPPQHMPLPPRALTVPAILLGSIHAEGGASADTHNGAPSSARSAGASAPAGSAASSGSVAPSASTARLGLVYEAESSTARVQLLLAEHGADPASAWALSEGGASASSLLPSASALQLQLLRPSGSLASMLSQGSQVSKEGHGHGAGGTTRLGGGSMLGVSASVGALPFGMTPSESYGALPSPRGGRYRSHGAGAACGGPAGLAMASVASSPSMPRFGGGSAHAPSSTSSLHPHGHTAAAAYPSSLTLDSSELVQEALRDLIASKGYRGIRAMSVRVPSEGTGDPPGAQQQQAAKRETVLSGELGESDEDEPGPRRRHAGHPAASPRKQGHYPRPGWDRGDFRSAGPALAPFPALFGQEDARTTLREKRRRERLGAEKARTDAHKEAARLDGSRIVTAAAGGGGAADNAGHASRRATATSQQGVDAGDPGPPSLMRRSSTVLVPADMDASTVATSALVPDEDDGPAAGDATAGSSAAAGATSLTTFSGALPMGLQIPDPLHPHPRPTLLGAAVRVLLRAELHPPTQDANSVHVHLLDRATAREVLASASASAASAAAASSAASAATAKKKFALGDVVAASAFGEGDGLDAQQALGDEPDYAASLGGTSTALTARVYNSDVATLAPSASASTAAGGSAAGHGDSATASLGSLHRPLNSSGPSGHGHSHIQRGSRRTQRATMESWLHARKKRHKKVLREEDRLKAREMFDLMHDAQSLGAGGAEVGGGSDAGASSSQTKPLSSMRIGERERDPLQATVSLSSMRRALKELGMEASSEEVAFRLRKVAELHEEVRRAAAAGLHGARSSASSSSSAAAVAAASLAAQASGSGAASRLLPASASTSSLMAPSAPAPAPAPTGELRFSFADFLAVYEHIADWDELLQLRRLKRAREAAAGATSDTASGSARRSSPKKRKGKNKPKSQKGSTAAATAAGADASREEARPDQLLSHSSPTKSGVQPGAAGAGAAAGAATSARGSLRALHHQHQQQHQRQLASPASPAPAETRPVLSPPQPKPSTAHSPAGIGASSSASGPAPDASPRSPLSPLSLPTSTQTRTDESLRRIDLPFFLWVPAHHRAKNINGLIAQYALPEYALALAPSPAADADAPTAAAPAAGEDAAHSARGGTTVARSASIKKLGGSSSTASLALARAARRRDKEKGAGVGVGARGKRAARKAAALAARSAGTGDEADSGTDSESADADADAAALLGGGDAGGVFSSSSSSSSSSDSDTPDGGLRTRRGLVSPVVVARVLPRVGGVGANTEDVSAAAAAAAAAATAANEASASPVAALKLPEIGSASGAPVESSSPARASASPAPPSSSSGRAHGHGHGHGHGRSNSRASLASGSATSRQSRRTPSMSGISVSSPSPASGHSGRKDFWGSQQVGRALHFKNLSLSSSPLGGLASGGKVLTHEVVAPPQPPSGGMLAPLAAAAASGGDTLATAGSSSGHARRPSGSPATPGHARRPSGTPAAPSPGHARRPSRGGGGGDGGGRTKRPISSPMSPLAPTIPEVAAAAEGATPVAEDEATATADADAAAASALNGATGLARKGPVSGAAAAPSLLATLCLPRARPSLVPELADVGVRVAEEAERTAAEVALFVEEVKQNMARAAQAEAAMEAARLAAEAATAAEAAEAAGPWPTQSQPQVQVQPQAHQASLAAEQASPSKESSESKEQDLPAKHGAETASGSAAPAAGAEAATSGAKITTATGGALSSPGTKHSALSPVASGRGHRGRPAFAAPFGSGAAARAPIVAGSAIKELESAAAAIPEEHHSAAHEVMQLTDPLIKAAKAGLWEEILMLIQTSSGGSTGSHGGGRGGAGSSGSGTSAGSLESAHIRARNAYVNRRDRNGSTAIMHTVWPGHYKALEVLLYSGADPNVQNNRMNTALHLCCEKGHRRLIRLLIDMGADISLRNWQNKTCLDVIPLDQEVELSARAAPAPNPAGAATADAAAAAAASAVMALLPAGAPVPLPRVTVTVASEAADSLRSFVLECAAEARRKRDQEREESSAGLGRIHRGGLLTRGAEGDAAAGKKAAAAPLTLRDAQGRPVIDLFELTAEDRRSAGIRGNFFGADRVVAAASSLGAKAGDPSLGSSSLAGGLVQSTTLSGQVLIHTAASLTANANVNAMGAYREQFKAAAAAGGGAAGAAAAAEARARVTAALVREELARHSLSALWSRTRAAVGARQTVVANSDELLQRDDSRMHTLRARMAETSDAVDGAALQAHAHAHTGHRGMEAQRDDAKAAITSLGAAPPHAGE